MSPASEVVARLNTHADDCERLSMPEGRPALAREAAALISSLVAERDALAKVIDPEDNRPALMARIIMTSVSRQARIYELEDLVEQAFRDGLAYGGNVENADPDVAWQHSKARATLSTGGVNG